MQGCPDKCDYLKDCIQCFVHGTGDFAENEEKCHRKCLELGLVYDDNRSQYKIEKVGIATSKWLDEYFVPLLFESKWFVLLYITFFL